MCLVIVGQGLFRVETDEGELKKEFDNMMADFQREQEKIELQNIELAKNLQVNLTNYFKYYYILLQCFIAMFC